MKPNPEEVMQNLRKMIDEAERILCSDAIDTADDAARALRDRMSSGMSRLRESYDGMEDRVKHSCREVEDRIAECYHDLEDRLRDAVNDADQGLRRRPYQSMAVTFGLGLALGILLRARR